MKHLFLFIALCITLPVFAEEGLIGYWPCDESEGTTVKDVSGNAYNATGAVTFAPGKVGGAVKLNGTPAGALNFKVPTDKQPGTSSFSVAMWVNPSTLDIDAKEKRRRMFGIDQWPAIYAVVDVNTDGVPNFSIGYKNEDGSKGSSGVSAKKKIAINAWSHIAVVFDRENMKMKFYINGIVDGEGDIPKDFAGVVATKDRPLSIGSGWQNFSGLVDEVRFYKKAITADDVAALSK
ncbi:MAG: LamG domain-containing protein [Spirochaetes bacterium]|nr:LamG domain-containing protein [Spirochaetota bacterium]